MTLYDISSDQLVFYKIVPLYLAIILSAGIDELRSQSEPTRSLAGLILKNNVRQYFMSLPPNVLQARLQFIRTEVIKGTVIFKKS